MTPALTKAVPVEKSSISPQEKSPEFIKEDQLETERHLKRQQALKKRFCSGWVLACSVVFFGSSLSLAIALLTYYKNVSLREVQDRALLDQWEISLHQIFASYDLALYALVSYASGVNGNIDGESFRLHSENILSILGENDPENLGYFKFVNISEKQDYEKESLDYVLSRLGENTTLEWNKEIAQIPEEFQRRTEFYPSYCPDECFYPIQYVEPLTSNLGAVNFDILSRPDRQKDLSLARKFGRQLSHPFELFQDQVGDDGRIPFSVALIRPVLNTLDFVDIIIKFDTVLKEITKSSSPGLVTILHQTTKDIGRKNVEFVGGTEVNENLESSFVWPPVNYHELIKQDGIIGSRRIDWSGETLFVTLRRDYIDRSYLVTAVLIAFLGIGMSVVLAYSFFIHEKSVAALTRSKIEAKNAKVIAVERARTEAEKSLNEYIAHEVRNPLSVAYYALNFVSGTLVTELKTSSVRTRESIEHDLHLVGSSLQYIHELLNNMLDLNQTKTGIFKLEERPTNIRDDILQPVKDLLHRHTSSFDMKVLCPASLYVNVDPLRLKQIVLNLAKNSTKFVETGFIRLTAKKLSDEEICITVDDSGPGIPDKIRQNMFQKYQFIGDRLRQGSGIGLCLCKGLVDAMNGTITLREDYDSGVPGHPGSSFVITIPRRELSLSEINSVPMSRQDSVKFNAHLKIDIGRPLRILIVDDEVTIREVLKKTLQSIISKVEFAETSTGESAIELVRNNELQLRNDPGLLNAPDIGGYDVIFVDQFMSGSSLLMPYTGEETIRFLVSVRAQHEELRRPFTKIIGISANTCKDLHISAGADEFVRKPLPPPVEIQSSIVHLLPLPPVAKVLVVDDEQINVVITERVVQQCVPPGWTYSSATSGEAAIDLISSQAFDVIFVDKNMKNEAAGYKLDGSDVVNFLRNNPKSKSKNAVVMHISGDIAHVTYGDDSQDNEFFLGKPLPSPSELSKLLKRGLYLS
mmetsp:Transcript_16910/g.19197  ORF Transcript_16910/g.19197 Transcript_16910/m.19197 type:complete len:977 (+) Transcript_16910:176-3106(+)